MQGESDRRSILVTGATGYIGGRLVPRLLEAGHRVRCMVRNPERLRGRPWHGAVGIDAGDVLQPDTLPGAMREIDAAYYLIHSLAAGPDFHRRDDPGACCSPRFLGYLSSRAALLCLADTRE